MENEEEYSIRDKFASDVFATLLSSYLMMIKDNDKNMINEIISEEANNLPFTNTTKLVRASYKIADIMRKVRLGAFE